MAGQVTPRHQKIMLCVGMIQAAVCLVMLSWATTALMATSKWKWSAKDWYVLPLFPITFWLLLKLFRLHRRRSGQS